MKQSKACYLFLRFFFQIVLIPLVHGEEPLVKCAVTYDFQAVGRFGDQLLGYCNAKLVSLLYDIPLLCKPMDYSDQLILHEEEEFLSQVAKKKFSYRVKITRNNKIRIQRNKPILYVVNMHSDLNTLVDFVQLKKKFTNEKYLKELRHKISPRLSVNLEKIYPPAEHVAVAVHVRTGGGWDTAQAIGKWPLKFPSKKFYIQQIEKVTKMFPGKSFYVHVFTDDQSPELLAKEFQEALHGLPLTFATRYQKNAYDQNVLDDFFGMMNFDCLIRPFSSFSQLAEKLGNFKVVISPAMAHWNQQEWVLDRLLVTDNRAKSEKLSLLE